MDEDSAALSSTAVPTDKVKVVKVETEFKKKTTRNANTAKEGGKGDAIDTINLISEDEDADGVVQDASGGAPASGWSGIDGTDNDGEGTLGTRKRTRQPAQGQQQHAQQASARKQQRQQSGSSRQFTQEPLELHGSTNPSDEQNQDTRVLGASIDNLKSEKDSGYAAAKERHIVETNRTRQILGDAVDQVNEAAKKKWRLDISPQGFMRELASHLLDLNCDISKIQNEIQDIVEARLAEKGFTNGDIRGVLTAVNEVWHQIQKTQKIQQPLQIFSNETINSLVASPPATHGNTLSHNATHCNTLPAPWVQKDSTCAAGGGGDVGSSGGSGGRGRGGPAQGSVGISGTKGKEAKESLAANAEPRDSGVADPVVAAAADEDDQAHVAAIAAAASDAQLSRGGDAEGEGTPSSVSSKKGTKEGSPDLPCSLRKKKDRDIFPKSKAYSSPATEESFAAFGTFLRDNKIFSRDAWRAWFNLNPEERERREWPYDIVQHFNLGGFILQFAASQIVSSDTPAQSEKHVEEEKEELDGGASALRSKDSMDEIREAERGGGCSGSGGNGIGGARDGASAGANVNRYKTKGNKQHEIQAAATPESITITMKLSKNAWIEPPEGEAAKEGDEVGGTAVADVGGKRAATGGSISNRDQSKKRNAAEMDTHTEPSLMSSDRTSSSPSRLVTARPRRSTTHHTNYKDLPSDQEDDE
mmetsp:Transcript_12140/g.19202  ORF Transcript_12140/g.19202 Transcript_12140/m.19202 type:complete len:702 (+) Transcript_12140:69-2174(+)